MKIREFWISNELARAIDNEPDKEGFFKVREVVPIEKLVDRFLCWSLPKSVNSDQCVCVANYPNRVGTNLLTADEAKQMIEYLLAGDDE